MPTETFKYPLFAPLESLESTHEDYDGLLKTWRTIDDLVVGGHQIEKKKSQYILKRPGENDALYALRLAKFAFTPVLGGAVKDLTTRLVSAPFHVSGCEGEQWDRFRGKTDGIKRDERSLLSKIFRDQICFGRSWVFIDRPRMPVEPLNRLQEEMLGSTPYAVLLSPLDVINWGFQGGEISFVKIRQIIPETSPFEPQKLRAVWTIVDGLSVVKYAAYVKIDSSGKVTEAQPIKKPLENKGGTENTMIPMSDGYPIAHGRSKCPVAYLPIDPELWAGNAAYLKAKQHLQIENAWTDTATIAGYVQRTFKPDRVPDSDTSVSYVDSESDLQDLKSSNQHILIGDFKFEEASGSSLQTISEYVLDKLEHQIKAIVSLGGVSAAKGVLEQSGVSKEFDYFQLNEAMKTYGRVLCEAYEEILKHVAIAFGIRDEASLEAIKVSGLDTFNVDNLGTLIDNSLKLQKIESRLSPLALQLWFTKVSEAMNNSADAETKEQIRAELKGMGFSLESAPGVPGVVDTQQSGDPLRTS